MWWSQWYHASRNLLDLITGSIYCRSSVHHQQQQQQSPELQPRIKNSNANRRSLHQRARLPVASPPQRRVASLASRRFDSSRLRWDSVESIEQRSQRKAEAQWDHRIQLVQEPGSVGARDGVGGLAAQELHSRHTVLWPFEAIDDESSPLNSVDFYICSSYF